MLNAGQALERYTVVSGLGTGGMAAVYLVRHNQLDSLHALKVLTVSSPQIRQRLLQEGKVQAALRHTNVVAVTDVIDVDGAPGLVMEYIEGDALDERLARGALPVAEAERIFRGVLAGVAAAHHQGVVHRDLKPANVMLSGAESTPKVMDFGLAKAFAESDVPGLHQTRSGMTMGTPAYMAPEQIRDAKGVDARADLFSMGCILYEMVCGQPPFTGPDILSIFNAVASGHYAPPISVIPDIPAHLHEAIVGCLVVDRERRIPDCATLQSVLDGGTWRPIGSGSRSTWTSPAEASPAVPPAEVASAAARVSSRPGREPSAQALSEETYLDADDAVLPQGSLAPRARTPSMASLTPRRSAVAAGALVVLGGIALLGLAAAGGAAYWLQADWARSAQAELSRAVGVPVTVSGVSLRTGTVSFAGVQVQGAQGSGLVIDRAVAAGSWSWRDGGLAFQPASVVLSGARLDIVRGGGDWHLPAQALSVGARLTDMAPSEIQVADLQITWRDGERSLRLSAQDLAWSRSAGGLDVGAWQLGSALAGDSLALGSDGLTRVEQLDVALEVGPDGRFDVPVGVGDYLAVYLGGESPGTDLRRAIDAFAPFLPAVPTGLTATGGELSLIDRAHGVGAVRWDAELSQLSLGPVVDGFLPFDAVASLGGARITAEGDVDADGLLRGRISTRRLPLSPMMPYLHHTLEARHVMLEGGLLDADVRFTMKGEAFAGRLTGTVVDAALSGPAAGTLPTGDRALASDAVGVLTQHDFAPTADWLDALGVALLGDGVRVVPPPAAPAVPTSSKGEPVDIGLFAPSPAAEEGGTVGRPGGEMQRPSGRRGDASVFSREVRDALDDMDDPAPRRTVPRRTRPRR